MIAVLLLGGLAMANRVVTETKAMDLLAGTKEPIWNKFPIAVVLSVCVASFLYSAFSLFRETMGDVSKKMDKKATYVLYAFAIALFMVSCYAPNLLNSDSYHITAALTSIYDVAFNTPYNMSTTSIYGHYAIFFWPFLKVFGHTPQAVAAMVACAGGIAEALLLYTINKTGKSETIKRLAALGSVVPIVLIYQRHYFQAWPLRILPPILMMAYCAYCGSSEGGMKKKHVWIGYILCAIATTWVTDAGLIATIAYSAWLCCVQWQRDKFFSLAALKMYARCIAGCILSVFGMVLIVNIYNVLICGASFVVRDCFFPFIGTENFAGSLQLPLYWMNISWIWCLACFFVAMVVGLLGCKGLAEETPADVQKSLLFLFGIMGLGQSGYYFNRAAYHNLTVVLPEAIVCMALLVSMCIETLKQARREGWTWGRAACTGGAATVLFEMAALAAAVVLGCSGAITNRINKNQYNMDSLTNIASAVSETVPENTYAVGIGTQEVYALLGWDTGYHLRDVCDYFGEGMDEVIAEIESHDTVLFGTVPYDFSANWKIVESFPAENPVLRYCKRSFSFEQGSDENKLVIIMTNAPEGLKGVSFAVWSADADQDDLVWYQAEPNGDGRYTLEIDLANHLRTVQEDTIIVHAYGDSGMIANGKYYATLATP